MQVELQRGAGKVTGAVGSLDVLNASLGQSHLYLEQSSDLITQGGC